MPARLISARIALGFLFLLAACRSESTPHGAEITVAAAANLTDVMGRIGPQFEAQTGIHPVFSFASTAQLARQIEDSAPFDVFAAADSEHVDELGRKGLLTPGSRAVYVRGVLALWIPPSGKAHIVRIEDLASPGTQVIAIAKPELAPYGLAAVDSLQHLGIWDQVKAKVVYAENINIAKQYGASGNADAVFTAYSLVLHETGTVLRVEDRLHKPIDQEVGIIAKSDHQAEARRFVEFLRHGAGKGTLLGYGYEAPAGPPGG